MLAYAFKRGAGRGFVALPGVASYSSERIISIDRSGLIQPNDHQHSGLGGGASGDAASELSDHLRALIRVRLGCVVLCYLTRRLALRCCAWKRDYRLLSSTCFVHSSRGNSAHEL